MSIVKKDIGLSREYGKFRPHHLPFPPYETALIHKLKTSSSGHRATVLEAPPGYGKCLVLDAVYRHRTSSGVPCAWISLDDTESTRDRVADLIIDACSRAIPGLSIPAGRSARSAHASGRLIASILSSSATPLNIFIDNLEYCRDPRLGKFLDQVIALSCCGHLWIATSRLPSFDCTRYVTEGILRHLQTEDLRFTVEDTAGFLKERCRTVLSPADVDSINDRTLGWPLAVSLLASVLSEVEKPSTFIAQFSGADEGIASFLRSQLLDRLDKNLSRFLLAISSFRQITVDLCRYACKEPCSRRLLSSLLSENCYLQALDRNAQRYAFHPLVREFLAREAEIELDPESFSKILGRATEWSRRRGNTAEAVEYALATQRPEIISKILHEVAPAWVGQKGGLASYINWVELAKRAGAPLTIESEYWYLWALLFTRQHQAAFKQSELLWERSAHDQLLANSPSKSVAFRRRFEELRILVDIFRDRTDEAGRKALKWLEDSTAQNDISMATVACCVAINASVNFDFMTARDAMHTAQAGIISANSDYGAAWVAVLSAQIDYYEGEYCHCYETLNNALARAVESLGADSVVVSTTQLLLASCLLQMGMREEARKYLIPGLLFMPSHGINETTFCGIESALEMWDESAESPFAPSRLERLIDSYPPPMNFVYRCFLTRRLLRLERCEDASLQAELVGIDFRVPTCGIQTPSAFVQELTSMTRLEYMMCKGMNRQAIVLAESLLEASEAHKRRGLVVELEIILAILAFRSENPSQALRHVHRAIRLAAKRSILQPFLIRLPILRTILAQCKEKDWGLAEKDERGFFQKLCAAGPFFESRPSQSIVGDSSEVVSGCLTARELELLRLANAGLSNQQIAERSNVALTTVKWHFSNIYSKLGVRNRSAATAKVRALNLL